MGPGKSKSLNFRLFKKKINLETSAKKTRKIVILRQKRKIRQKTRGYGTRARGKRAHGFWYACPAQTCCRAHLVLSMSHVGHAKEHALACSKKISGTLRARFNQN